MNDATLAAIEAEIRARTGIDLGEGRRLDLHRALQRLSGNGQGAHAEALADVLTSGPPSSLVAELVSAVTVNETHFWRIPQQFEALQQEIFPELAVGRRAPIRVWSAACSTGPEPYSITMAADSAAVLGEPGIHVAATDVDEGALRLAAEARYGNWAMRGVDDKMRRRWFFTEPDGSVRPVASVRAPVAFSTHSILDRWLGDPFDVVLCRNVLIYFDEPTRRKVVGNLLDALVPGGVLFVAPAEMQSPLFEAFEPIAFRSGALAYRRPARARRPGTPRRTTEAANTATTRPTTLQAFPAPAPTRVPEPPPVRVSPPPNAPDRPAAAATSTPRTSQSPTEPPQSTPIDIPARLRDGLARLDAGEGPEAVRVLREAVVLAPDSADAHAALALALLHERADQRAAASAKRALVLLGGEAETTDAGRHAMVVLGTLAALEETR